MVNEYFKHIEYGGSFEYYIFELANFSFLVLLSSICYKLRYININSLIVWTGIFFLPLVLNYFIFSPFPWDISEFKHVVGMFDGVVFILLFISIYGHRQYIKSCPPALILMLFVIFLSLIFSIAVGNFGTGIRHRSKILPIIIVIAAPYIYRILFVRRKN